MGVPARTAPPSRLPANSNSTRLATGETRCACGFVYRYAFQTRRASRGRKAITDGLARRSPNLTCSEFYQARPAEWQSGYHGFGCFRTCVVGYVVLDRYSPHLRLFDLDGRPLWSGGNAGDGPKELSNPQGLAVGTGAQVAVAQQSRLSWWKIAGDSLVFDRSLPIPGWYRPLAVEYGCSGTEWLLYARDNRQFLTGTSEEAQRPRRIDQLHRVEAEEDEVVIEALWAPPPAVSAYGRTSHRAAILTRLDTTLVLYHRMSPGQAGSIYTLDCSGGEIGARLERPLIVGGDVPAKMPQPRPMQWTNRAVPIAADQFLLAIPRWEVAPDRTVWLTEFFRVSADRVHSILVRGQWRLYDYHARVGVLLGRDEPLPHMVAAPPVSVRALTQAKEEDPKGDLDALRARPPPSVQFSTAGCVQSSPGIDNTRNPIEVAARGYFRLPGMPGPWGDGRSDRQGRRVFGGRTAATGGANWPTNRLD